MTEQVRPRAWPNEVARMRTDVGAHRRAAQDRFVVRSAIIRIASD